MKLLAVREIDSLVRRTLKTWNSVEEWKVKLKMNVEEEKSLDEVRLYNNLFLQSQLEIPFKFRWIHLKSKVLLEIQMKVQMKFLPNEISN